MQVEIPEFQKCCLCLPLRSSLFLWGCLNILFSITLQVYYMLCLIQATYFYKSIKGEVLIKEFVMPYVMILVLLVHVLLQYVLIIGAFKKFVGYLRVYYIYSLIVLVLAILVFVPVVNYMIERLDDYCTEDQAKSFAMMLFGVFLSLVFQAYVPLIVRSLIKNLNATSNFKRFGNSTTEDNYNMKIVEPFEVIENNMKTDEPFEKVEITISSKSSSPFEEIETLDSDEERPNIL